MGLDMYLKKTSEVNDINIANVEIHEGGFKTGNIVINEGNKKVVLDTLYRINNITLKDGTSYYVSTVEDTDSLLITFKGWDEADNNNPIELITIDKDDIKSIHYTYAYWRKANQIHNWFVQNIQGGQDDQEDYTVLGSQLLELVDICKEVLSKRDENFSKENLPTVDGFFFGSTSYDEYYYTDLEETIEKLKDVQPNDEYTYGSSW
jgi:hypothetical protein